MTGWVRDTSARCVDVLDFIDPQLPNPRPKVACLSDQKCSLLVENAFPPILCPARGCYCAARFG